ISPDGKHFWDGQRWVPLQQPARVEPRFSDDRQWYWNGTEWVPANQAPAPAPPPAWAAPPAAGTVPQGAVRPAMAAAAGGAGLLWQLGGPAAWSIGFGVASIGAPLFANFYFYVLPLFGLLNGVRAIQRGRVIGGIVGIVLNILGGIASLLASGLLFH
ncbi:MAG TPA: hypothetical protein VEW68_08045, partial [Patescibacteria group bacterium]|nr:hypothetical protein [Patescibacteria group bacterium]